MGRCSPTVRREGSYRTPLGLLTCSVGAMDGLRLVPSPPNRQPLLIRPRNERADRGTRVGSLRSPGPPLSADWQASGFEPLTATMMNLRASELGRCVKCSVAICEGYSALPTGERLQGLYDRGIAHEQECLAALADDGWTVIHELAGYKVDEGQVYVELPLGGAVITGHLDGIADGNVFFMFSKNPYVLEIKSPSTWTSFKRAARTATWTDSYMHQVGVQLAVYMHATGLEAVVACVEEGRVKTFGVETPPFSLDYLVGIVAEIEQWVARGELPTACSQADWPCPVAYLHVQEADERLVIDDPDLEATLREDVELTATIAAGSAADKARKELRRSYDTRLGVGKYRVGSVDVTSYEQANPRSFDEDAMRADGVYDKYLRPEKKSRRYKIGTTTPSGIDDHETMNSGDATGASS